MARAVNAALNMLLLALLGCGGCQGIGASQNDPPKPLPPGSTFLLHLPGVAGDTVFDRSWMGALQHGGVADRVELYDWTCRDPGIDALQAYSRNWREAGRIAQLISNRVAADPTGHVILTAESGGAALAVWALERLPRKVRVDQVLLVQPAISPVYDLSPALKHVKRNIYYTSSPGDWFVLGLGTRVFGTSDGQNSEAAGYVGFRQPSTASAHLYQRLIQLRYDPAWMRWGDFGSHTGAMSTAFAYHVLAPLLTGSPPVSLAHHSAAAPLTLAIPVAK